MAERNPFDQGETLLLKESNKRLRYLEKDEIDRLLAECPKHLRNVVECAINTGMRRGEILKLKWTDVDLKTGHIYVRETKTRSN